MIKARANAKFDETVEIAMNLSVPAVPLRERQTYATSVADGVERQGHSPSGAGTSPSNSSA
jgi:hypothetical protein